MELAEDDGRPHFTSSRSFATILSKGRNWTAAPANPPRPLGIASDTSGERLLIGGQRPVGDAIPGELLLGATTRVGAEPGAELVVGEEPLQRLAQRRHVA